MSDLTDEVSRRDPGRAQQNVDIQTPLKRLLWVDDHPENNAYELARLRGRGVEVVEESTTDEALRLLHGAPAPFDVVVTDMGRDEGGAFKPDAGLELIRAVRTSQIKTPIYVYSTSKVARERSDEVRAAGGDFIPSSPLNLFEALGATG